ncbi:hypothetical protein AUC69_03770 [Methyloceanibacter superfactus]|uniref:DUF5640 domain-containing protein n=1 Tax=Methyloceanibacter superfactus TaxID=1774969 RepID=A0A1E3VL55_9HYPH|nr:hypothetical protein [Methyloceanibacter superfactus]ODR94268.1 hypothetical protein AUC69_03770 [Methyloceanibacter superfactus]
MKAVELIRVSFAACLIAVLTSSASFAGDWAGKYMTADTKGNAFSITLSADGTAAGEKQGHVLKGTWEDGGEAAVIKWETGWTTKLSKDGDRYKKTAYRPGASMEVQTDGIGAEKIE